MAKLEGIIYSAFSGYVVLRGYAPIGELADISKKPDSYQRNADNQHKIDIVKYLSEIKSYFPEITLACRVKDYEGLIKSIGDDKPQFNEWEVTNNSIKSQIADKLNIDVSEVVIYNYLSSNSNDLILIYGRYYLFH